MASPQCEDGYTKIANELLEAICHIRIPGESMQIFLTILRKTYGYGKKEDRIALSQFAESTGINKPNVVRGIKKLAQMNIVIQKDNGYISTYCINKDFAGWEPLSKKITLSKKIKSIIQKDNKLLSKKTPTKERKKKENIYSDFFEELWDVYPNKDGKKDALRHFNASVKNDKDKEAINIALGCYLEHLQENTWKKAKNGSTWFNNWRDWIPEGWNAESNAA